MASGTNGASNSSGQQALDRFAQMMIERMEKMKGSDWEKGWIGGASSAGLPHPLITHALSPPPAMPTALSRPYFAANPFPANINKYFGKYFSKYFSKYFGKYNVDFAAASLELEAKTGYNKLNFSVWRLLCRTITVYCPVPASCWVCLPVSPPERHPPSPWMTIWHWTWAWISKNIQPPRLI